MGQGDAARPRLEHALGIQVEHIPAGIFLEIGAATMELNRSPGPDILRSCPPPHPVNFEVFGSLL